MKLKVLKEFGMDIGYEAYVVGFVRSDGQTLAVILYEDGSVSSNSIENITLDFFGVKN